MMTESLQTLIKACQRNDMLAQKRFYDRFAPKMMGVCYRYARDRDDAEDMLQEGFTKVFQRLHSFRFEGSVEGWIRRIIVHTAIDQLRKRKNEQYPVELDAVEGPDYAENIIDHLELDYLFGLIQNLPDGYRLVFNLFAIEGYSHGEIAEKLGISASTSRSQYTRARAILKQKICEDNKEPNLYRDVS